MSTGKGAAKSSEISSLGLNTSVVSLVADFGAAKTGTFFVLGTLTSLPSLTSALLLAVLLCICSLASMVAVFSPAGRSSANNKELTLNNDK